MWRVLQKLGSSLAYRKNLFPQSLWGRDPSWAHPTPVFVSSHTRPPLWSLELFFPPHRDLCLSFVPFPNLFLPSHPLLALVHQLLNTLKSLTLYKHGALQLQLLVPLPVKCLSSFFRCAPLHLPLRRHPFLSWFSEASLWVLMPWTIVLPGYGGGGPSCLFFERHCRAVIQNMVSGVSPLDSDFSSARTLSLSLCLTTSLKNGKIVKMMALNFPGLSWRGNELIHEKPVGECLTQWSTNGLRAGSFCHRCCLWLFLLSFCADICLFQSVFALSWPSLLLAYVVPEGNLGKFMSHTVWVSHPYTYDLQVDFP